MLKLLKLLVIFLIITLLHCFFLVIENRMGIHLNFMLSFAIASCLYLKSFGGYTMAFLSGIFLDFLGTRLFGANAFSYTILAFCVYEIFNRFDFQGLFSQFFSTFTLGIVVSLVNVLLFKIFVGLPLDITFWKWLISLFGSTLIAPLPFLLFSIFFRERDYKKCI